MDASHRRVKQYLFKNNTLPVGTDVSRPGGRVVGQRIGNDLFLQRVPPSPTPGRDTSVPTKNREIRST